MDFYNLQDSYTHIIEEGFFHVPENVLKPIKDFYIENQMADLTNISFTYSVDELNKIFKGI